MSPRSGWGDVAITGHEDWNEADAAYLRAVERAIARRRSVRIAYTVRLIPYRTALTGQAVFDELLALDDFDLLPAAREFQP